ncbi:uncharacterized protein LOC122498794 [Leptopilina heterotoma]|uniref:uncharacterized protein LOC122498794 n=1 Tax=Leptopilina heterotoma TaxID=63436 RepID=UPI001CA93347|nr:uncharacterized protein LOC122498794 [Leptopilina heterotoma]
MDSQNSKKVPHVRRSETGNLTITPRSDAQVHADCRGAQFLAVPRVVVERLDTKNIVEGERKIKRSASSLLSVSSCSSGKIAHSAIHSEVDDEAIDETREICLRLRKEEATCLDKMELEVAKMIKSCDIQRNVNRTVKDGL